MGSHLSHTLNGTRTTEGLHHPVCKKEKVRLAWPAMLHRGPRLVAHYSDSSWSHRDQTHRTHRAQKLKSQSFFNSEALWFAANSIANRKLVPSPFAQRESLILLSSRILQRCPRSGSLFSDPKEGCRECSSGPMDHQ